MVLWSLLMSLLLGVELPIQGSLSSRLLFRIDGKDSSRLSWFSNAGSLVFAPEISEQMEAKLGFTLRADRFPKLSSGTELSTADRLEPVTLLLDEAYIRLYNPVPNMSVTIGRQKVHWGSADAVNPTDNFTTPDYSDPLTWDARRPVWMAHLGYSPVSAFGLEFGVKPIFEPAINPPASWYQPKILPTETELRAGLVNQLIQAGYDSLTAQQIAGQFKIKVQENVRLPGTGFKDFTWGGRVKTHFAGLDLALSGLRGYDFLPATLASTSTDFNTQELDLLITEFFPPRTVLGAELATNLAGVGLWAEAGYSFYNDSLLKDELSVIAGLDYSIAGFYLNLQYLHGDFPLARLQLARLKEFLLGAVERRFVGDRLLIRLGGVLDIKKRSFGLMPAVIFTPFSGLELELTGLVFSGSANSAFAPLNKIREIGGGVKYRF